MDKQQKLNEGYPQSDPTAASPPKGVPWLAALLVALGLIVGLLVIFPAMAIFSGAN